MCADSSDLFVHRISQKPVTGAAKANQKEKDLPNVSYVTADIQSFICKVTNLGDYFSL